MIKHAVSCYTALTLLTAGANLAEHRAFKPLTITNTLSLFLT